MQVKKYKSSSLERQVRAYPPEKYHNLIEVCAKANEITKSKVINMAVKQFFDQMSQSEKERMVNISKNSY